MLPPRVIPCLLLKNAGLVKTVRFKDPTYVGDPINAVKIFNDKEVDELIFLDIAATVERKKPQLTLLARIAGESFMPFSYGGGIRSVDEIRDILRLGVEKVCINSQAVENPPFIQDAARVFGSSTIVVSLDVKKSFLGKYEVVIHGGRKRTRLDPVQHARFMEKMGAGELMVNSVDRDGTMAGYDLDLIKRVSEAVSIPVIACGGAGRISDFGEAVKKGGASAVAAGSLFVFHGKHRAVLISYPSIKDIREALM